MDLFRTIMGASSDKSFLTLIRQYEGGFLGLFRGVQPTLFRDVPFSAFYWAAYDKLRNRDFFFYGNSTNLSARGFLGGHDDDSMGFSNDLEGNRAPPTVAQSFISGALAGAGATILTHPFDVVKTRFFSYPRGRIMCV